VAAGAAAQNQPQAAGNIDNRQKHYDRRNYFLSAHNPGAPVCCGFFIKTGCINYFTAFVIAWPLP
jgi:hypothetical protein